MFEEIMITDFPELTYDMNLFIPRRINQNKFTPRKIVMKLQNTKTQKEFPNFLHRKDRLLTSAVTSTATTEAKDHGEVSLKCQNYK